MAPCCATHDRMDLILQIDDYNDTPCGTPTNPRGEQRYCCRQCPSQGRPLPMKAEWAGNPVLMAYLSAEERAQVLALAITAGPLHVDVVSAVPAPVQNATDR